MFEKAMVTIYTKDITDEEVRRLAATHNVNNKGSRCTTWAERVAACRQWRYQMDNLDPNGPTPPTTTEWRTSCQNMYVEGGKVWKC